MTKFDIKLLHNPDWRPTEDDKRYMGESWEAALKDWQAAEDKVLFSNLRVDYDSCDCGDGFGCSHGSWPYQITVIDDKEASITFEDEGILFEKNHRYVNIQNIEGFTMEDFVKCCEVVGIDLKRKESPF